MLVRDGDNYLELTVVEHSTVACGLGDIQFAVRVRVSSSYIALTAESLCWVDRRALAAFAKQLQVLEDRRQGSSMLESMSPGELHLEVRSTDRAGQMAAVGQVGQWLGIGTGEPYWSAVAFRVAFCPSELAALVREFCALADPQTPNHLL